ncbi:MAG: hypothetical protein JNJ46_31735 [Myxococcales bacterium]|nr:hypothetical protein [Myxococcales bacterium]
MSHLEPASPASCPLVQLKIVYYGPSGSGKTETLRRLAARLLHASRVFTLDASEARTLFFDLLPIRLTHEKGSLLLRLISVPGSPMHRPMRRLLLRGADGVILLPTHDDADRAAATPQAPGSGVACRGRVGAEAGFEELRSNLRECGMTAASVPVVSQDSPWATSDEEPLITALRSVVLAAWPSFLQRLAADVAVHVPPAEEVDVALLRAFGLEARQDHRQVPASDIAASASLVTAQSVPCGPQSLAMLWSAEARSAGRSQTGGASHS